MNPVVDRNVSAHFSVIDRSIWAPFSDPFLSGDMIEGALRLSNKHLILLLQTHVEQSFLNRIPCPKTLIGAWLDGICCR